jgi:death on curing protein
MTEPIWLSIPDLIQLHDESIARHGGLPGVRDQGLLESSVMRPRMLFEYGDADPAAMASAYGHGIAKNHPFFDGNKRAGLLATGVFLALNGLRISATPDDLTAAMLGVASGDMSQDAFAVWLRVNCLLR